MAKKIIKAHMKQRRDTKANWASVNPVLLDGELGFVSDDPNLYKIGDGETAWNDLPFRGFDGTITQEPGSNPNTVMSQKAVTESLTALQESVTEKTQELMRKKADQDGKYPELTAGFANNLVGRGEAVDATIGFRPSGGMSIEDGAARVKELKGNSVVWNQKASAVSTGGNISPHQYKGVSVHHNGTNADSYFIINGESIVGHKYLIAFNILMDNAGDSLSMSYGFPGQSANVKELVVGFNYNIITAVEGDRRFLWDDNSTRVVSPFTMYNICLYDLTQMFGAGNEPTTIEEFYNRIPQNVDLYAYNEGEIISTNAEGIKSVGFNAWDEEWERGSIDNGVLVSNDAYIRSKNYTPVIGGTDYFIYSPTVDSDGGYKYVFFMFYNANKEYIGSQPSIRNAIFTTPVDCRYLKLVQWKYGGNNRIENYGKDICLNLSHTGYRNEEYQPYMQFIRDIDSRIREAFPNGMRSAGTASDKVYNKNGKGYIEKRIGVVDMGSLEWSRTTGASHSFYVSDFATRYGSKGAQIVSSIYQYGTAYADSFPNLNASIDSNSYLYARNDSYSDAATFKAAMSGVPLFYELAEPEILEFDEPFNLDYEVWDFGTEQMLSSQPSAPIKASIVYGFNAVDSVRTAQLEIAELKTQIAQMQAIMASLTAQTAMIKE